MKVNNIYYLTVQEMKQIQELPEKVRKKWDNRIVRNIDDYFVKKNKGIGGSRTQRRRKKFQGWWRDGEQKSFYEHKTKRVLTKTERKKKRKKRI